MNAVWKLSLVGAALMLGSCTSAQLDYYKGTTPVIDIKTYFNGHIKAWGLVQDWRGRVVNQFDIDIEGKWDGDNGQLREQFTYYNGEQKERIWTLKKLADGSYQGTAPDILDKAKGTQQGNAARWNYEMDLPVGDTHYRIRFDDWMWQMHDGVLINRSYLKKFGIRVSELTIVMQKQSAVPSL